jgi:hypothetical protein
LGVTSILGEPPNITPKLNQNPRPLLGVATANGQKTTLDV